ncbi:hypothetical protein [Trichocoleus desertorum]|uniref:hypothetical protein n=1 Tax=Trichocoleus desertorum TaxID=1481672 RepID=UPI003297B73E
MPSLPPLRIEDAKAFSCCSAYKNWQICIYAGSGWAYIIYTSAGDRYHYGYLPAHCLDVQDGEAWCRDLCDRWEQPLGYEEVRLWRDICEFMASHSVGRCPFGPEYIAKHVEGCWYLLSPDRTHRQRLWDLYKIQLIKWESARRNEHGWILKGNWEDKIDFLEQVYILDRNPDTLPRPWLDKWERKQRRIEEQKQLTEILRPFDGALFCIQGIEDYFLSFRGHSPVMSLVHDQDMLKRYLDSLKVHCATAREKLKPLGAGRSP